PAAATSASRFTVAAIFDQAAISGPLSCEQAGGSPAMIWARSLFIISVVNPGAGECCQVPPFSSNFLPSAVMAAPSLPADHWEITVRRGFAPWALERRGAVIRPAVTASMARRLILFIAPFPPTAVRAIDASRPTLSIFKHLPRPLTSLCARGSKASPRTTSCSQSARNHGLEARCGLGRLGARKACPAKADASSIDANDLAQRRGIGAPDQYQLDNSAHTWGDCYTAVPHRS